MITARLARRDKWIEANGRILLAAVLCGHRANDGRHDCGETLGIVSEFSLTRLMTNELSGLVQEPLADVAEGESWYMVFEPGWREAAGVWSLSADTRTRERVTGVRAPRNAGHVARWVREMPGILKNEPTEITEAEVGRRMRARGPELIASLPADILCPCGARQQMSLKALVRATGRVPLDGLGYEARLRAAQDAGIELST